MKQKTLSIAALIGCAILAFSPALPVQADARRPSDILDYTPEVGQVTKVIDGQTIQVSLEGGPVVTVRYIGINAPTGGACMASQAANANAALVLGQTVRMESDAQDAAPDGTLFRYVYLLNARMTSEELIKGGYAVANIADPNIKHQGDLNDLETQARASGAGGWSACGWKSSVVMAPGTCLTIPLEDLAANTETVPELGMLHDGDCVIIDKAANPNGPEWSGKYIYHPAGSVISYSSMYLRWKDGMVNVDVDQNGVGAAHVIRHTAMVEKHRGPYTFRRNDNVPAYAEIQQVIHDTGQPEMLEIQNPRTWLLKDLGNGKVMPLIDAFTYVSGDFRDVMVGPGGYLF
ncbi:MAG: thermonuclease family protein [Chloroflexi bacterium]|nr:thermonuclease family protein [Chloroflexota bacterium]MCL5274465.1 thermonuclease family protein [Chloroflexota bacterium]